MGERLDARAVGRGVGLIAAAIVALTSPRVEASERPRTLALEVHLAATLRVGLSTNPLSMDARLSMSVAPPLTAGGRRLVRSVRSGAASPSWVSLVARGDETFGALVAPAAHRGYVLTLPPRAEVDAAVAAASADARQRGVAMAELPAVGMVALPRPDRALAVAYDAEGGLCVAGSLYVWPLRREAGAWTFDRRREQLVEPYVADLPTALTMAAPPFGAVAALKPGTEDVTFAGFGAVVCRALGAILGSSVESVLAKASCTEPVVRFTTVATSEGLRASGRTLAPLQLRVGDKPCLTIDRMERCVVVDPASREILRDEGRCAISGLAVWHVLGALSAGSGQVSYRMVATAPDRGSGHGDARLQLLGVGGR